jgi:hypothetical protein
MSRRAGDESHFSAEILKSDRSTTTSKFLSFIPLVPRASQRALRTRLAGPKMFATSFGNETRKPPPSAASAEAYRVQALTSTTLHAASSDLLPEDSDDFGFESPRGRSDMWGRADG